MKKSILLMAGLVGLALTSCSDDMSTGVMQKNEAPVEVPMDGVALQSQYNPTGNTINLANYEEAGTIELMDIEISTTFPEGTTVSGEVEVATTSDFSKSQTLKLTPLSVTTPNATVAGKVAGETRSYKGVVMTNAWNQAFQSFYGLNPAPEVNYLRYRLWLNNGKQNIILYTSEGKEWFDTMQFMVTPIDAQLDIASSYTLHYLTNGQDEQTVEMYHNPDNHVYDDPVFNANVEVTQNEDGSSNPISWWITPTGDDAKAYGVAGEDPAATAGELALLSGGDAANGTISDAGVYKIEANMLELTYTTKLAPPSLYVVSTTNISFAQAAQLGTEDNIVYSGIAGIESKWGLTGQAAYKPTFYSNNAEVDTIHTGGTVKGALLFDTSGAPLNDNSAIPLPGQRGCYYVTANLQTLEYTAYRCNTMGITGSMAGVEWGAGPDVALQNSRTTYYMTWTGKLTVAAGDEWKIRANADWAVNFGGVGNDYTTDGQPVTLTMGGDNFVAAEAGTYNVTVYLRRVLENGKMTPYYMTVTPAN